MPRQIDGGRALAPQVARVEERRRPRVEARERAHDSVVGAEE